MTKPTTTRVLTDLERVLLLVERDEITGCWVFTGGKTTHGYGTIYTGERQHTATHRLVYEALNGHVADDLVIDHLCRNKPCCNPKHLEAVPQQVNIRRGLANLDVRGTCRSGKHDMTIPGAFYVANGIRGCIQCRRDGRNRRYRKSVSTKQEELP